MDIFIADNYEELSRQAADDVIQLMQSVKNPLLCTASGDSPAGLYREIADRTKNKLLDVSDWYFVGLDEWGGMNGNDEGSCRYHLNNQLFSPLQISSDHICFFDGRSKDLEKECQYTEDFIRQHGGIHVAILGLGINGHIGMNEPGTSPSSRSHVTAIDPLTQQVGQKYFKKQKVLTEGITLGLATLMEARHICLIVSGRHKADIVRKVLEGPVTEQLPATLLKAHRGLKVYLDTEAAQQIQY